MGSSSSAVGHARATGLVCADNTDSVANAYFNSTLSGLPANGICLPGFSVGATAPSRVCQPTGVWSGTSGSCNRTWSRAEEEEVAGTGFKRGEITGGPHFNRGGAWSAHGVRITPELSCPNGNLDYNAAWPDNVAAGSFVQGSFCKPGFSGLIGRECLYTGQWAATATGGCTRTCGAL